MEKETPTVKIICPICNGETTMKYIQDYPIDVESYGDNLALDYTDDLLEPEMSRTIYDIHKDTGILETSTTGTIAIIGKHRVGGLFSKTCFTSETFTKIFNYYFIDHEKQLGGYTFRFIEEMIPSVEGKTTIGGFELDNYIFRPKDDKIQKSAQHVVKGVELRKLEKYGEAISCFEKALDIDPTNPNAWSSMGVTLRQLGKPEEALAYYDKALKIDPNDWMFWLNKGISLDELKNYQEALDCFKKASEIEPGNPTIMESIEITTKNSLHHNIT